MKETRESKLEYDLFKLREEIKNKDCVIKFLILIYVLESMALLIFITS